MTDAAADMSEVRKEAGHDNTIAISIQMLDCSECTLTLSPHTKVCEVKDQVEQQLGISAETQNFFIADRDAPLDDNCSLLQCGVKSDMVLTCLVEASKLSTPLQTLSAIVAFAETKQGLVAVRGHLSAVLNCASDLGSGDHAVRVLKLMVKRMDAKSASNFQNLRAEGIASAASAKVLNESKQAASPFCYCSHAFVCVCVCVCVFVCLCV